MTRVLIVDDEPESRTRLRDLLQAHGHVVTEASNGLDALERARQQPPDLVISDILMPQMDGFALCRASRADPALSHAPFVFYTGTYATAKDAALARRLGATRFLVKSMAAEEVIRAITEALRTDRGVPAEGTPEPEADETESWRLYNESLIKKLEHRNLEMADEVRDLRALVRALEYVPALVSVTDTRGRITFVNRRFEQATGFTRDMVRGQTHAVMRTRHGEAGLGFEIRAALLAGREWRGEFEQRRKDGTAYWERAVIAPIFDDSGTVTHFLRLADDVTEEKGTQQIADAQDVERRQAERVETVERLAGGVAHDFNNLLTVVIGHAHLLLGQLSPSDPLRTDVAAILEATSRGTAITQQLLTYARRDVVHPLVLDPAHAIAALARTLQRQAGDDIRLGFSLGPDIWPVWIDPAQFDRMVVELVANARDAIAGHGAIDLSLRNVSLSASATATPGVAAGEYVALRVSDTGAGIAPDVLPRIFEPFFTTRRSGHGAGLGLSSVAGTVEQARGHIHVERTGPDGTTFLVLLPRSTARAAEAHRSSSDTLEGSERILLVEDEPAVLELMRRTLESYGYTVLHASTPDRALRAMQDADAHVDLLLTDVVMPGMNGRELATQLRGLDPTLRVLFMSGYSSDVVEENGLLPSDVALITKPFSPTALAARVRDVLDAPAASGAP
jgi:two-component system cell cycle sensor histidine kinase/response regulator CckA